MAYVYNTSLSESNIKICLLRVIVMAKIGNYNDLTNKTSHYFSFFFHFLTTFVP